MNIAGFIVFSLMLLSIAVFHKRAFECALAGLVILIFLKYAEGNFSLSEHLAGNATQTGEWKILLNLFGLLTGFEVLSNYFTRSGIPRHLPKFLPDDWKGGFVLLAFVFILSSFLDNIAAAVIGGTIARVVFRQKVHIGFIAAIVAASNAGGSGSVLGDTTTTMMWISGISPSAVMDAYIGSIVAFFCFAVIASRQQDKYQRILKDKPSGETPDLVLVVIILLILLATALSNALIDFPAAGLWGILLLTGFVRKFPWNEVQRSLKGSIFLLALVMAASLLPVHELPSPSVKSTFFLGMLSSVFDNIPLTKISLEQGGYDWGLLAYAVGFGGSMIWFGSSAGVALSNLYPGSRSVFSWLKNGWHIAAAYVIGFATYLLIAGWHPM